MIKYTYRKHRRGLGTFNPQ